VKITVWATRRTINFQLMSIRDPAVDTVPGETVGGYAGRLSCVSNLHDGTEMCGLACEKRRRTTSNVEPATLIDATFSSTLCPVTDPQRKFLRRKHQT
jgi:hypothetical protein